MKIQTLMQNLYQQQVQNLIFRLKQKLDDFIRDLGLTKSVAELLTSRLIEWSLLCDDCKSTAYRKRHSEFSIDFDVIEYFSNCKDVEGLFRAVGINHDPTQWRLFIDSFTKSRKAVLPQNGSILLHISINFASLFTADERRL